MTRRRAPDIHAHNDAQIGYYSRRVKATMVPALTPYVQRHLHEVLTAGRVTREHRILEVGCGMGRFTWRLSEGGYQVEGVELAPFLIERLHAASDERKITVHCCDLLDAPDQVTGLFDRIVGFFMLHHLPDLPRAFSAMARMLKPGGVMAFAEPNPFNPLYYVQISLTPGMNWAAEKGMLSIRRPVIEAAVRAAGLCDLTWRFYGAFPPFLTNLPGMPAVEQTIERLLPMKSALAFQVLSARRP
jgi:2-polyprenyl-3-methyl-5-hydroxy-6-metoxy-1,4-benzoquinol methylase